MVHRAQSIFRGTEFGSTLIDPVCLALWISLPRGTGEIAHTEERVELFRSDCGKPMPGSGAIFLKLAAKIASPFARRSFRYFAGKIIFADGELIDRGRMNSQTVIVSARLGGQKCKIFRHVSIISNSMHGNGMSSLVV